ncbi:putative transposase, partial [Shigella flexneri K-304]
VWLSRVWALLRRQAELDGMPAINAKRVLPAHAPECAVA